MFVSRPYKEPRIFFLLQIFFTGDYNYCMEKLGMYLSKHCYLEISHKKFKLRYLPLKILTYWLSPHKTSSPR
jgi:hypothetical protein